MGKNREKKCREKWLYFSFLGVIFLSGCAKAEVWSTNVLEENIGTNSEELVDGLAQYEQYKENNIMTEDGEIISSMTEQEQVEESTDIDTEGKVHVTFAKNSLLDVSYYSDAELNNKLTMENCWLVPNDCIYADIPVGKNEFSNMYSFESFRIYQYDAMGKRTLVETVPMQEERLVYQIPMLAEGVGISIVPVGQYTDRVVAMSDYVVNSEGEAIELSGKWMLNNKEYYQESATISPLVSYVVSYQYDKDVYYFVSATPENACHYPKEEGNTEGEVIFKNQEPEKAAENFSVELHKYLSATIDNKSKGLVSAIVKDRSEELSIESQLEINKLKCGSVLEVKTDKVHKLDCTNLDLEEPTEVSDGYLYTVVLPEVAETKLNLSVLNWDKKTVAITVDKSSSESWWKKTFGGSKTEDSILVLYCGDVSYTYEDLQEGKKVVLNEYDDLEISVNRNFPEDSQVYITINGKEEFVVNSDSVEFRKVLDYDDVSSLRIVIQNTENENVEQETKLKVVLDKSLDENILFDVDASGKKLVKGFGYIKGKETIFNGDVDAEQDIVISAKSMQLNARKAIKLSIKKDGKTTEIRYARGKDLSEVISTMDGDVYCGEIEIMVSMVDVVTYHAISAENCTIALNFADADKSKVEDGDILEESRDVVLTITAKEGYYLDNAIGQGWWKENDFVYRRELEYSDYEEKIMDILEKNPVKKLITVTLDATAPYQSGTVIYEVGGESKPAGTYSLKEGETVKLTFKITEDSGYGIVNEGVTAFINKYLEKETVPITISPDKDGMTIRVEDYMKVEKEN